MISRKDNKESSLLDNTRDKDTKYSDTGRDGDYSQPAPTSVEEGDEDYDDEVEDEESA